MFKLIIFLTFSSEVIAHDNEGKCSSNYYNSPTNDRKVQRKELWAWAELPRTLN